MYKTIILLFIICCMSLGCSNNNADYVAKIGNKIITREYLDYRISKLPESYQAVVKSNKKNFLDELIVDELLYREALKKNLDKEKEASAKTLHSVQDFTPLEGLRYKPYSCEKKELNLQKGLSLLDDPFSSVIESDLT